jgi:curved DNA-binding protein CbpA
MTERRSGMRAFEGKNFYEILNLPLNAGQAEIEQAYTDAVEMYEEEALATYALFTDEQRENLLQTIEEAFQTLSNEETRSEYNQMLISTGQAEAAMFSLEPRNSEPGRQEEQLSFETGDHSEAAEHHSKEEQIKEVMDRISEKGLVSGEDLRILRESRGIDHSKIYQRTRISKTTLENIEQNQYEDLPADIFLKAFLKSYAEILQIDTKQIVDGYLKYRKLWPGGKDFIMNLRQDK